MTVHTAALLAVVGALFSTLGCERKTVVVQVVPPTPMAEPVAKTKTLETSRLGAAVDSYARQSSTENHAEVKKAMADLDGEIAELEVLVAKRSGGEREEAAVKLKNLQSYRAAEMARFTAAQARAPLAAPASGDGRTGAEKVEDAARRVGHGVEDAARKTGDAIKDIGR
ncbi:MAG: hypothetical protein QOE70_1389 [Chthoniobacter sp.]|jgi:hypothetical protein|nr:hypothetical protein [Chthoniobacter sp.]